MLLKLFIPALVLLAVYLLGRFQARRARPEPVGSPRGPVAPAVRLTLFGVAGCVVLLSGWFIHDNWQAARRVVEIRVINVQSGEVTRYEARHDKLFGRAFETLDGRRITLANSERMEVQP